MHGRLACKQAHLCELVEKFGGANRREMGRGKEHFTSHAGGSAAKIFPELLKVNLLAGKQDVSIVDSLLALAKY